MAGHHPECIGELSEGSSTTSSEIGCVKRLPIGAKGRGSMDPALSGGHKQGKFRIYDLAEKILMV